MSNDYKFDLKKFNKNFDLYDNILLDKIIYENQEYLNNKKYLKKNLIHLIILLILILNILLIIYIIKN